MQRELFRTSVTGANGSIHQIKQSLTCKTKDTCYLINCKRCNQQYTGETKLEFNLRLNNHTSDIRLNKKSIGMRVRHFNECGLNSKQPIISKNVRSSDPFIRKPREQNIELLETDINAQ